MFKIGEFSRLTQVSIRMLRYYDQVGLLKPEEKDSWTGYRMYSARQIPVLNKIVYLRDSGFTLPEIAEALAQKDDATLIALLEAKYAQIEQTIEREREKLAQIAFAQRAIAGSKEELHYQITIKDIPSYRVLSLRRIIPDYYAEGALWQELSAFAAQRQIDVSGQTFSVYHDTDFRETQVDVELCVPVKTMGSDMGDFKYRNTQAVPSMACTMSYGDFSNIAGAYAAFADWLQKNSRWAMYGSTRQIVHRGPWNEEDPEKYVVEIQIPVRRA